MNRSLKTLTLSGLLVASLFAGTTTQASVPTRIAAGLAGTIVFPLSAFFSYVLGNTAYTVLRQQAWQGPSGKIYSPQIMAKSFLLALPLTAVTVYANYKLLKHAFSSEVPQKDADSDVEMTQQEPIKKA